MNWQFFFASLPQPKFIQIDWRESKLYKYIQHKWDANQVTLRNERQFRKFLESNIDFGFIWMEAFDSASLLLAIIFSKFIRIYASHGRLTLLSNHKFRIWMCRKHCINDVLFNSELNAVLFEIKIECAKYDHKYAFYERCKKWQRRRLRQIF